VKQFIKNATVRGSCLLLAYAAVTLESGCTTGVYSRPVRVDPISGDEVVYVDTAPRDIELQPHYYYGGSYVYYVDGRWYRRGPSGWGYYRQEPPALTRQRPYVQQAPAAPRERSYVQVAPAAPREIPYAAPQPGVVEAQPRSREVQRAPPRNENDQRSR
jgi:hypothetical protein